MRRPAEPKSITNRVVHSLRRSIIVGDFKPGEKLKIDALKERLQVGASPIREALSLLTSDHLVERMDQRGFRVAPATKAHFEELLKTRCWLEGMALRESIAAGSTEWEEAVVLAHHRLSRKDRQLSVDPEAEDSWEALHKQFHLALIAGSGSSILERFCAQLYDQNIRYRYLVAKKSTYRSRDVSLEHADIVDAALDRDADLAVSRLTDHYRKTGTFFSSLYD
jgi:GntR family carbon starvation induced transcriptional regulator